LLKLLPVFLCLSGVSLFAQASVGLNAPAYKLGQNATFDASNATLIIPKPAFQSSSCNPGQIQFSSDSLQICTSSRTWLPIPPLISQLSGTISLSQLPATISSNTTGNAASATVLASAPVVCVTGKYASGIATNGNAICATIQAAQLSGLAASATVDTTNAANITSGALSPFRLPNPTTLNLGGVRAVTAIAHQWLDSISTFGIPHLSQPAAADITGLAASATTDATNANNIVSGALAITHGGTGATNAAAGLAALGGINASQAAAAAPVQSIAVNGGTPRVGNVNIVIPTFPSPGLVASSGVAFSDAVAADVIGLFGSGSCLGYLKSDGTCDTPAGTGGGTISSVGVTVPTWLAVSPGSITSSGTFAITAAAGQTANQFLATPNGASGALAIRGITAQDLPVGISSSTTGTAANVTGIVSISNGGTGSTSAATALAALGGVNASQAAASAPVQSVNGQVGSVSIAVPSVPGAGLVKSSGSAFATAASTDVISLFNSGTCNGYLKSDGTCSTPSGGGTGTVSSVGVTVPSWMSVSPSTITTSGTFALSTSSGQVANSILATPDGIAGAVALRPLASGDLPANIASNTSGTAANVTGTVSITHGGTGAITSAAALAALGGVSATQAAAAAPVQSVNGQTGTVALTIPSIPAAGVVKSSGTDLANAAASDVVSLFGSGSCVGYLKNDGTCSTPNAGAGGTVTSVSITLPSWYTVSPATINTAGTFAVTPAAGQTANRILATPDGTTGALALRALTANDIPASLTSNTTGTSSNVSGTVAINHGGTGATTATAALTALGGVTSAQAAAAAPVQTVAGVSPTAGNVPLASTSLSDTANLVRTTANATYGANTYTFAGAAHTSPLKVGLISAKPATCTTGELYFATDALAGQQIYECSSTNVWTQQLNTGTGTGGNGNCTQTASQLSDLAVAYSATSGGTLTINSLASATTPTIVQLGSSTFRFTAPSSVNVTGGGSGTAFLYVDPFGVLTVASTIAVNCTSCTSVNASSFPTGSFPIATWTITSGAFTSSGYTDFRSFLSGSAKVAAPATSSSTCTVGQWATDTGFFYSCTATNTWKRSALSTF
jgi:hypothetical protein